jgi:hypothetical protein
MRIHFLRGSQCFLVSFLTCFLLQQLGGRLNFGARMILLVIFVDLLGPFA